ncbi:MAG: metallophosphoesterase [Magnetococcus sp. DMHC-6]
MFFIDFSGVHWQKMNKRLVFILFFVLVLGCHTTRMAMGDQTELVCSKPLESIKINVFGDSRTPYHIAKLRILTAIKKEKPDIIMHLGDMVANASDELWAQFDREEGTLKELGVPFLPIIGNHEILLNHVWNFKGLANYFKRFPELKGSQWYSYSCGQFKFLGLNSQTDLKSGSPQRVWLEAQLQKTQVTDVVVVSIHEPLISAKEKYINDYSDELRPLFAGKQRGGAPVALVLSGHFHNYERFIDADVHYITSGGGGSPPHFISRLPNDLYSGGDINYEYIRIWIRGGDLLGEMLLYDENSDTFSVADTFNWRRVH